RICARCAADESRFIFREQSLETSYFSRGGLKLSPSRIAFLCLGFAADEDKFALDIVEAQPGRLISLVLAGPGSYPKLQFFAPQPAVLVWHQWLVARSVQSPAQ